MRVFVLLSILAMSFSSFALPAAVYNVQSYGAVGDGVTDDTLAIRAAGTALQTAAIASGLGGKLLFPPGKYLVFSPGVSPGNNSLVMFSGLKGVNVISDGATITIGRQLTTSETGVLFGFISCTNVTVDGFTVTGPSLNIPSGVPHGLNVVALYEGNVNVSMPNNKVQGVMVGLNCATGVQPRSRNVVVGNLYASDSLYGISGNGCDDLVVNNLTTADVLRSYVGWGVKNHTINITSNGSFSDDVPLGAPLENVRLSYTSPAAYTFPGGTSGSGHARVRMSFFEAAAIRNVDIRLNVVYDGTTQGGPAFRLRKENNVPGQTLENLRISGYVKGKPNNWPTGDPDGPIIGTVDTPNYWSTGDNFRNIELSDLRIEGSKAVRFILPGLKGPFLIENVHSDNAIQLVQATSGGYPNINPPHDGLYTIVNSTFPNLASYYAPEVAEQLDPINVPISSVNIPVGWQGHTLSTEWIGGTVTHTLPTATRGLEFSFIATSGLIIVRPQVTQNIRGGGAGVGLYLNTPGDGAKLRCVLPGTWEIVSSNGTFAWVP